MATGTDLRRIKLALSHIPLGTPIALHDSVEEGAMPMIGKFAGLGLSDGEDLVNITTKSGKAGMKLDDLLAIMIGLK